MITADITSNFICLIILLNLEHRISLLLNVKQKQISERQQIR